MNPTGRLDDQLGDADALVLIAQNLRGLAITWFYSLDVTNRATYSIFRSSFIEKFTTSITMRNNARTALAIRRQGPQETIQAFGLDINALCNRVNPNMPEDERVETFTSRIHDVRLMEFILSRGPKTLDTMGGHLAFDRVYGALQHKYYWRSMYADVQAFIAKCPVCDLHRRLVGTNAAPLSSITPTEPFDILAIDVAGDLSVTERGNRYYTAFVCLFSRWIEVVPLVKADASSIAHIFLNTIVCRYGSPRRVLSDQGSIYTGGLKTKVAELVKYKHVFTSAYHPQTNGMVERLNRTVKETLRKFINENQTNWDVFLPSVVFAYNTTPHSSTVVSPYFLFGRDPITPLDRVLGLPNLAGSDGDVRSFIIKQHAALKRAHEFAVENIATSAATNKRLFDDRNNMTSFAVGDLVYLHVPVVKPGRSRKFTNPWRGPYRITAKRSDALYMLEGGKKPVNIQRLRRSRLGEQQAGPLVVIPPAGDDENETDELQDV